MEHDLLYDINANNRTFNATLSICLCFLLSCVYLGSLHVWNTPFDRNHPSTIKKRFFSVFVMLFIAPCFLYLGLNKLILDKFSFYQVLGLRTEGLCQAIVLPLSLTIVLFLGPISMELYNGITKIYLEPTFWYTNLTNLIWIRNLIVAPFTEEFTYRCCMLPLLLQYFQPFTAICINPLFFGLAHFHHLHERVKFGMDFDLALKMSCFQFFYTTIFGMYSAYLFYKTSHFASIFIVHAFCNHMGFPNVLEISSYRRNKQILFISLFIIGFVLWLVLLRPLTEPTWYYNRMPWTQN